MARRMFIFLVTMVSATSIHAKKFSPPTEIVHSGETYTLVHKSSAPKGPEIFEYTTNSETIDKWSSLVTISYLKKNHSTPLKLIAAFKSSLDREKPKPHYSLYLKEGNGYFKIIYEPNSENPDYESDAHKSFHIKACGGIVIYQFAKKYPASTDTSPEGKLLTLKKIADENTLLADDLEKSDWLPNCG